MKQVARSETRTGVVVARGKVRASESETLRGWTVSIASSGGEDAGWKSAPVPQLLVRHNWEWLGMVVMEMKWQLRYPSERKLQSESCVSLCRRC